MVLLFLVALTAPEDSNAYYYMDRMLSFSPDHWQVAYDSSLQGLQTVQGCHDLKNWYIDLNAKAEAWIAGWFGVRYRYVLLGDYERQRNYNRFEPRFRLKGDLSLLVLISPSYRKSDDEFGLGIFKGHNDLNSIEAGVLIRSPSHNFSLKDIPDGPEKIVFRTFPLYGYVRFERGWDDGFLKGYFEKSNTWHRVSRYGPGRAYWFQEKESFTNAALRFLDTYGRVDFGGVFNFYETSRSSIDRNLRSVWLGDSMREIEFQPRVGYRLSEKWKPSLAYLFGYKVREETLRYKRAGNSQYLNFEFFPNEKITWHFGFQREWISIAQEPLVVNHRLVLGFEYSFPKGRLALWEGIEADPSQMKLTRMHNHTYIGLLLRF